MNKILVVGHFLFFSLNLFAQDSLSLSQAIETGLDKNFSIQIEELRSEIADRNNTWGVAGRYPSINLIMGQNNNQIYRKPTNPFQFGGSNTIDNFTNQVDVEWILFNGFRVSINKNRLDELEKLSMGNLTVVIENTIQNIILGYNIAVLESKRFELIRKVLRLSKERYELIKLRREVGSAIKFDVLQEENNYLTDSSNYLTQQLNYKNAIRNLNLVLNQEVNKAYILTDSLTPSLKDFSYDELNEKMLSSNSNLKNQFINQSLLKYNTQLTQSSQYPLISVNFGANSSNDRLTAQFQRDQPGVYSTNYGYSYGGYVNFALRFNIYNGGQLRRNIQNARVEERIGELSTSELKQALSNELNQLVDLYNLRKNLVQLAEANSRAASLNVELANERYKNGYLSAIENRIIQVNYLNTTTSYLEAIYNLNETYANLLRITGGIVSEIKK